MQEQQLTARPRLRCAPTRMRSALIIAYYTTIFKTWNYRVAV